MLNLSVYAKINCNYQHSLRLLNNFYIFATKKDIDKQNLEVKRKLVCTALGGDHNKDIQLCRWCIRRVCYCSSPKLYYRFGVHYHKGGFSTYRFIITSVDFHNIFFFYRFSEVWHIQETILQFYKKTLNYFKKLQNL